MAAITFAAVSPARATDFTTYGFDGGRDGWNSNETILTPANVPGVNRIVDITLGGSVADAQPLYLSSESTPLGVTNVAYVATEDNYILAYSPRLRQQVWRLSYGNGNAPVPNTMTGCTGETEPTLGITGTPVIDTTTDTMYFVTDTVEGGQATFRLHAISPGNGSEKIMAGGSLPLAVSSPNVRKQRPALALANGNIYIAFGGAGCDYSRGYSFGEIFAYSASTLQPVAASYRPAPASDGSCGGQFLDSIWMSGNGPAVDPYGNIWFTTGNGCLHYPTSLAQSLIRLSPTLTYPNGSPYYDSQMANNASSTNASDADLGAGGVSISTNGYVVYGGKDGVTWITGDNPNGILGGYCYNPCLQSQAYSHMQTNGGLWGSSAVFTAPDTSTYIATGGQGTAGTSGLGIWRFLGPSRGGMGEGLVAHTGDVLPTGGVTPLVTSNGTTSGTYVVWFLKRVGSGQVYLYGYNAENLQLLTTQQGGLWTRGRYAILAPTVADGYVMVASDNRFRVWTVAGNFAGVKPASTRHK